MSSEKTRWIVLGVAAGALVAACAGLAAVTDLAEAPRAFLMLFGVAFAAYATGLWAVPRLEAAPADAERYQTVYARREGAVAAPTAGLHLTDRLLAALDARGISRHCVTLHVGAGTFLPVKAEDTADHVMHAEWGEITEAAVHRLNEATRKGGRIVAVGTTSLRLLESAARATGSLSPFTGETDIFITPGFRFRVT